MFQFLHAADVHLDSPLRGLSRYETAPTEAIRGATRRALEALVELAVTEQVAFVLLAGDLFDGDWRDYNTGLFFNREMGRLKAVGIRVFIVAGNHDAESRITKALTPPDNVRYLSTKEPETVLLEEHRVAIHGQGFATQVVDKDLSANYPAAVAGKFNLGMLHTSLDGREGHAPYAPCSADGLRSKGYDYWALGHVHKREVVSEDPWIVFPGCLQGRHARETGAKGCSLVTVDEGMVKSVVHQPMDVVRWAHCTVPLEGIDNEQDARAAIKKAMAEEMSTAGDRTVAMRVELVGVCGFHDRLRAEPDRWSEEIRSLGANSWGDDLWIEKIDVRTQGRVGLSEALATDSALGELLRAVSRSDAGDAAPSSLIGEIAGIKTKLPPAVFSAEDGWDPADRAELQSLIQEARETLTARLLVRGDAP